jgi:two-component system response regulator
VILPDINLPKLSGEEVLKQIRSSVTLRQVPVVILSTSTRTEEVDHMIRLGANAYVEKFDANGNLKEKLRELLQVSIQI